MLDVDHGTYPFVTSSSAVSGGACTGAGVGPTAIDAVIGVIKAYTTRVGEGPFATELNDKIGERLRDGGSEYGATTGRPRRCGWFDGVVARYSRRINGLTGLALTKLDVLDGFPEIKVCTAYKLQGQDDQGDALRPQEWREAKPVYRTVKGWTKPTAGARSLPTLPARARDYVKLLEDLVGVPVQDRLHRRRARGDDRGRRPLPAVGQIDTRPGIGYILQPVRAASSVVEHLPFKQRVVGSIPTRLTRNGSPSSSPAQDTALSRR